MGDPVIAMKNYFGEKQDVFGRESLILVEGNDDAFFISALLRYLGIEANHVGITPFRGTPQLEITIRTIAKHPSVTAGLIKNIGIIVDADKSCESASKAINDSLAKIGWNIPDLGKVVDSGKGCRIGSFVIPNCSNQGDLESLLLGTASQCTLLPVADGFIQAARQKANSEGLSLRGSVSKRIAQVYIAGKSIELKRGAGLAAHDGGIFDLNSPDLDLLKDFLRSLIKREQEPEPAS